ncbi:hypothetical protein [Plantactinospora endophytica]|uniref:Uncharacterized protein n=1 Tax=Plantactinospora endophytica TaxID=673535 RepID=A0ABQ4DRY7_9ACTN|nr:hypothetical protein [Plantactinospora endophytica]GIG85223.1 hypothetical protein Pen02_01590 [Plantactinospora endophytica]
MRRAIEFLFTRILRSRLGIAIGLAVVILGIIGAARLVAGGGDGGPTLIGGTPGPISVTDPEAGDDGLTVTAEPTPRTSPGAPEPEAVARSFTTAWLDHQDVTAREWHDRLRPLATAQLAEQLTGVDPVTVPADRITGEPRVVPQNDSLVEVVVPVDSGELRLGLVAPEGRWQVDTVDWQRR